MRIGELARRTGVSARSLRHYEALGLIASTRLGNGYRTYDEDAVVRVRNIRLLLRAGLTCEEIKKLGECLDRDLTREPACDTAVKVYRDRLRDVEKRITDLLDVHQRIQQALDELRSRTPTVGAEEAVRST